MKINSFIFCGIILTACNCTTTISDNSEMNTSSTSTDDTSTSGSVFTTTEDYSSTSSSDSSTSNYYVGDLNFVETSSSTGDSSTGETISLCNNSENGECKVFITSMTTFPNIGVEGFDNLCTVSGNSSNSFRALIRRDGDFWGPFAVFNGQYVLPSGKVVATGTDSLQYASSINEDETGKIIPDKTPVWTGFNNLFFTCSSNSVPWETNNPDSYGDIGYVGGINDSWYTVEQIGCNDTAHVICVEMPKE